MSEALKEYASISLNFDSFAEATGFPDNYRDPTFFEIADRFLEIADEYGFKYSIYVVGRDLEKAEHRKRVVEWEKAGHEIGNHSWSHYLDLGALKPEEIRSEISKTHELLSEILEKPPVGFISPAWNGSKALRQALVELGYTYDTSVFPSWLMFPTLAKMFINHIGNPKLKRILHRKDFHQMIWGNPEANYRDEICLFPLPTNRTRIACWHTLAFMFGRSLHKRLLRSTLTARDTFYYLVHPADLSAPEDPLPSGHTLERVDTPLQKKVDILRESIELILDSGRKIVPLRDLVEKV